MCSLCANSVSKTFKKLGYRIVSFATGFDDTDHVGRDVRPAPFAELSEFHRMLVSFTPMGGYLPDMLAARDPYNAARERTLFLLDTLPQIAQYKEPTFTVCISRRPIPRSSSTSSARTSAPARRGSSADGNDFDSHYGGDTYREGYRRQAMFITREIEKVIDRILEDSPEPPDHHHPRRPWSGLNYHLNDVDKSDVP